jgi:hypothetical protein
MRTTGLCVAICTLWAQSACALLEEKFVSFAAGNGTLNIAEATILADADDSVGVHIALKSLMVDLEQITGMRPIYQDYTANSTLSTIRGSIIVGSVHSSLIQELSARGVFDVSDIEAKWEVFKTAVIDQPLPGIDQALVIAGSDKRGTIFGIHTLAEQSGQSP